MSGASSVSSGGSFTITLNLSSSFTIYGISAYKNNDSSKLTLFNR
jgi:hypothetical protein